MHNAEQQHDGHHQRRIEYVQPDLAAKHVAIVALDVLDYAEDRAHHNEDAGRVEDAQILAPRNLARLGAGGGGFAEAPVEDNRDSHEEAEEDELDCQPTNHDPLAGHFRIRFFLGKESRTCFRMLIADLKSRRTGQGEEGSGWLTSRLDHERQDITHDEGYRQESLLDRTSRIALHSCDNMPEHHVDANSHEDRCNQQQNGLEDIYRQLVVRGFDVGDNSADVSDCFKATANKKRNHVHGPRSDT